MGPPMFGALDALQDLQGKYHIIIHTTKANIPSGRKAVADWLEYYDVYYDEIVGKPEALWYIDDKAIKFTNWSSVMGGLNV